MGIPESLHEELFEGRNFSSDPNLMYLSRNEFGHALSCIQSVLFPSIIEHYKMIDINFFHPKPCDALAYGDSLKFI